jgi:putative peptide zinc metalloprotease protein
MVQSTPPSPVQNSPEDTLLASRLCLRGDLQFRATQQRGKPIYLVEDAVRGKFFHMGPSEFRLAQLLDGSRTVAQALAQINSGCPSQPIAQDHAVGVCHWLVQSNLVLCESPAMAQRMAVQANQRDAASRWGWINPLFLRIPLVHPNALIRRLTPWLGWMFSGWCLALWMALAGIALVNVWDNWDRVREQSLGIASPGRWLWIWLGWLALKFIHELAHGVACQKFGGHIGPSGVQLILLAPFPYVDVTSSWRFASRWQRIFVAAAGMYAELALSFAAILIWVNQPTGVFGDLCFNIFVLSGLTTILFNANPLMRYDGYYIASDALDIPNLYQRGQEAIRRWAGWLMLGTGAPPRFDSRRDALVIPVYGLLCLGWRVVVSVGILLAASVMFRGAGIVLACTAAIMWYGPAFRSIARTLREKRRRPQVNSRRLAASGGIALAFGLLAVWIMASPARKAAPCIVQFKDEHILRAASEGFVSAIHVRDGQPVAAGQPLVDLENKDLRQELVALEARGEQLKFKSRRLQAANQLSEYQSVLEESAAVATQLVEKRRQIDQLQIRSPITGFIDRGQLGELIGRFVKQGDPIATVSAQSSKEVLVSIGQSDLESVKHNVGHPVAVVLPGVATLRANLVRLDPQASETPLHPSLCACYGGPLPVHSAEHRATNDEPNLELLSPRFTATIELDPANSEQVHGGQRGIVLLATSRETIATNIYLRVRNWVYRKLGWNVP